MREYFHELADCVTSRLRGTEVHTTHFAGERSCFVRLNHSEVRQAGTVLQRELDIDLIEARRHASGRLSVTGDRAVDEARIAALLDDLRERRAVLPDDPHLLYATEVRSTDVEREDTLPEPGDVLDAVRASGRGRDLVGIYAAGPVHAGFANSLGQRNWYTSHSFNLDWSLFRASDRAVKSGYAGFEWDSHAFEAKTEDATRQLVALDRPAHEIRPGRYRVYLAPAALQELVALLSWGGFGLRAHRTKASPLLRMVHEGARLDSRVTLREHTAEGIAPNFESAGFIRPDSVTLVRDGAYAQSLVSPRSSLEYGVPTNGANGSEAPQSVDLSGGTLPQDAVLRELDTGIYVGNLWYLNYSDRPACRTTGMTRFATFWVEGGVVQAPLAPMRFDETLYRMLGEGLIDLTAEREMLLDAETYGARSTRSARLPGALIDGFTFTL